jgi:hypothetical protein
MNSTAQANQASRDRAVLFDLFDPFLIALLLIPASITDRPSELSNNLRIILNYYFFRGKNIARFRPAMPENDPFLIRSMSVYNLQMQVSISR